MRFKRAPSLVLFACIVLACEDGEHDRATRSTAAEAPRGRPIRNPRDVEVQRDPATPGEPSNAGEPLNSAASASDVAVPPETVPQTPLDPISDLQTRGFEALRMNDEERARIEAAIAEHHKLELPLAAFPERIRVLHGATTRIRGWMIPGEMIKGRARNFMLVRDNQACCFGAMPTFDEWIHVEMLGERGAEYVRYGQIEVSGVLEVGGPAVAEGVKPPALRMKATSCELIRRR